MVRLGHFLRRVLCQLGALVVAFSPIAIAQEAEQPVREGTDFRENLAPRKPVEEAEWAALPEWTLPELEKIRSGELELGTTLFEGNPEGLAGDELFEPPPAPIPDNPQPLEDEPYPVTIGEEFLASYFSGRPASYLVDPQGMLSMQQQRDRQSFLEYHAGDSEIDLFVYLFDRKQEVPSQGEIAKIFNQHFSRGQGLSALIYYFVGAPERSLMVMSPEVGEVVPSSAIKGALIYAKQQAESKSEPASQLESFSTALSIRLYWMEQELAKRHQDAALAATEGKTKVVEAREEAPQLPAENWKVFLGFGLVIVLIIGLALGGAWWRIRQRKSYHFPEIEVRPLLDAPHGAGVGAVIHFGNATVPPSRQKESVPDYLRQI
jgi:hypothetical protein